MWWAGACQDGRSRAALLMRFGTSGRSRRYRLSAALAVTFACAGATCDLSVRGKKRHELRVGRAGSYYMPIWESYLEEMYDAWSRLAKKGHFPTACLPWLCRNARPIDLRCCDPETLRCKDSGTLAIWQDSFAAGHTTAVLEATCTASARCCASSDVSPLCPVPHAVWPGSQATQESGTRFSHSPPCSSTADQHSRPRPRSRSRS